MMKPVTIGMVTAESDSSEAQEFEDIPYQSETKATDIEANS